MKVWTRKKRVDTWGRSRAVAPNGLVQRRRLDSWSVVIWTRTLACYEVGHLLCSAEGVLQ